MNESLLSHIAGKFVTDYENVANSSIKYMLNKYSSARTAVKNIAQIDPIPIQFKINKSCYRLDMIKSQVLDLLNESLK